MWNMNPTGGNKFTVGFVPLNLSTHWRKHYSEYPGVTKAQYAAAALMLIQMPCGENIRGYIRENGQIVRYNRLTHDYVVGNNDDTSGIPLGIATMYKLDELKYEQRMKEEAFNDDGC
jgi:hypothetical protein